MTRLAQGCVLPSVSSLMTTVTWELESPLRPAEVVAEERALLAQGCPLGGTGPPGLAQTPPCGPGISGPFQLSLPGQALGTGTLASLLALWGCCGGLLSTGVLLPTVWSC